MGAFARQFNDFGLEFVVADKNGEEPVLLIISDITLEEEGLVTLLKGSKHPFEDGDTVQFDNVEGMNSL